MDVLRTDIVAIFDLRFDSVGELPWELATETSSVMATRILESFSWIFYGENIEGFELFDVSAAMPQYAGAALRINKRSQVATVLLWRTTLGNSDPLALKLDAWNNIEGDLDPLKAFFQNPRGDRFFPFVAIQLGIDAEQLDEYVEKHAVELGKLLTSNLEGERDTTLAQYVQMDLSKRGYEKLFLRWTEALAVYSNINKEQYENCIFRGVQIFEHCILGQVSSVELMERMEHFSRHLIIVSPWQWFGARNLFSALSEAESAFIVYPRTQSVEARRLLSAAHEQFGLASFIDSAKAKGTEVREQFEWAKTQTLAIIGVLVYLLDKIIGWDKVKLWVEAIWRH